MFGHGHRKPFGVRNRRAKALNMVATLDKPTNMVVERAPCSAGGQVVPNRDAKLLFHPCLIPPAPDLGSTCAMIPIMRVGIDFRGAQCSGSGLRGIGRYTVDLIVGLIDFAPDIDLVLFVKPNVELPPQLKGCKTVEVPAMSWTDPTGALWTKIPKIRSSNYLHGRRCRRAIKEQKAAMEKALAKNPVDVLHIPSALDIGSYPLYDYPCPVVMTFLDAIVVKLRENTYNRFRPFQRAYYDEQSKNLARATHIVAISDASAKDAVEMFGIDRAKVSTVYPSVSDEYASPKSRPAIAGDKPFFLFCSVPDPHKNPDVTIKAFAKAGWDANLVMVSPKDSPFVPSLTQLSRELGVEDRVIWTGYVEEDELIGLFQHALAVISPSQMEGFGLPVGQAMRAGTRIITSKFSAQGEIARNCGLLVDPNSVDEVADAINKAMVGGITPEMIEAGIHDAHQFDAEKVTAELAEVYRRVAAR